METIKPVCPCKLNPLPGPAASQSQNLHIPNQLPIRQNTFNLHASNSLLPTRATPFTYAPTGNQHSAPIGQQYPSPIPHVINHQTSAPVYASSSSPSRHEVTSDPALPLPFDTSSSQSSVYASAQLPSYNTRKASVIEEQIVPLRDTTAFQMERALPSSSIPDSLPSSSGHYQAPNLLSVPNLVSAPVNDSLPPPPAQPDTPHPVLASLVEATSIYNLSNAALEQVIAEVIHEDGFLQLLEKISDMLVVRRIANA